MEWGENMLVWKRIKDTEQDTEHRKREGETGMEINIEPLEKEQGQLGIWNLRVIKDGKTVLAKDWEEEIRRNQ